MDMAEWLRGLGLEQYAPAFRDNDIDGEVLPRLTGEDLRELGVKSIGHRRRLLDAISSLGGVLPNVGETVSSRDPRESTEAERRQLTVMFCDLVGSIPRICAKSSQPITAPWRKLSIGSMVASRDTWAMAYWFISATRERMRMTLSGRCGRGYALSMLSVASM
jgi:hypothetical protein